MIEFNEYIKLTVSLFAITVPVAASAVYLGLTREYSHIDKLKTIGLTAVMFFSILTLFTFFGENILNFFSISIEAFKVAGGAILFLSALQLVSSKTNISSSDNDEQSSSPMAIAIVPLAMPMLVGPGTISTVVIYTHMHPSLLHELLMVGVILTNTLIIMLVFWLTNHFGKLLSDNVTSIVNRLMGLIIASMAVEFLLTGSISHIQQNWVQP
ncbi:MarC family protein [Parashewanella tropica]|uniref:MarC family protein n=1 Tax=Parashewanella tropica TaxID=2547970 RepID=UPI0010598F3D|nr:MarC family protein [Parashewanella tropica]